MPYRRTMEIVFVIYTTEVYELDLSLGSSEWRVRLLFRFLLEVLWRTHRYPVITDFWIDLISVIEL